MSFSSSTKNEISRLPLDNKEYQLAELAALVRMSGSIKIRQDLKISLTMLTENAATARRTFSIIKNLYNIDINVVVKKNTQLKKTNSYLVEVSEDEIARKILWDIGFIDDGEYGLLNPNYRVDDEIVSSRESMKAYIRGSFLGGGSVNNPEKSYHLEFTTNREEHAESLSEIINDFNLNSKIIERKEKYVVYLKEAEQISDILSIIGAHQALFKFEDVRVLKDMRNNVNRLVNCETANLSKTINASMRQVEDIKLIQREKGLDDLPPRLKEVAYLRLENRDASLKQIGEMLDPPVGKSGINHRFRKIGEIADEIRGV